MVPYNTQEDELSVRGYYCPFVIDIIIDRNYLVVGVKGLPPTIKGRLYSTVNTSTSVWQLEPRSSRLSARERTASTASTASIPSSYAYISDPDISSSFAASLESGQVSDADDLVSPSPGLSSPTLSSADDRLLRHVNRRNRTGTNNTNSAAASRSVSPGHGPSSIRGGQAPGQTVAFHSLASSYSSLESLHGPGSGRLLTLHLEKEQSIIWPSLIVGPAPEGLAPSLANSTVFKHSHELEHQYNMDPTSLALIGLELADIRRDRDEAFEYFLRAWHQAHIPSATMRLVSQFLPLSGNYEFMSLPEEPAPRGTTPYFLQCIGGSRGLAQLYLEAGLLHLEGAASTLLSASYSSLSSIRMPLQSQVGESGTEAWKRDREAASRYFDRARSLQPDLDIPALPQDSDLRGAGGVELEMPSLDLGVSTPESVASGESLHTDTEPPLVRRRKKAKEEQMATSVVKNPQDVEDDGAWYYYIPGLVGAGTALLVMTFWNVDFLDASYSIPDNLSAPNQTSRSCGSSTKHQYALIILNQPFSLSLLQRVWHSSSWRTCADGGANQLYDLLRRHHIDPRLYLPHLIEGDLDSIRCDVKEYYTSQGVSVVQNDCQNSTDLMKCVRAIEAKEHAELWRTKSSDDDMVSSQYDIVILGGLAGRLDQTIHTLSYLHKLRRTRERVYAVTDDNVGWVLDSTCGLLPVGIDETILSTTGLRWNLTDHPSSFDGLVSTSNHLVPSEPVVWVKTTKPIWWTTELRPLGKGAILNGKGDR
ncbi:hypothetical protein NP233_g3106 [Leucocoprinus birnbaumii]|uniref:Thiamin pyrophosphokinase thiamin-binding domain-containing protein n=1 Tax=Leucocoprinus birnbaumii TaxID=56174 RepID=A0AAD5VX54_9AGAR|nr:hypothetical protein NP233_g3106 [Leucocoprinus birnbaumii]